MPPTTDTSATTGDEAPQAAVSTRPALTRERVIAAAVALADAIGVDALTIRKLAVELDVKPMTIYHHVPNKEAIIDGMVDLVFSEIDLPPTDARLEAGDPAAGGVGPRRCWPDIRGRHR